VFGTGSVLASLWGAYELTDDPADASRGMPMGVAAAVGAVAVAVVFGMVAGPPIAGDLRALDGSDRRGRGAAGFEPDGAA